MSTKPGELHVNNNLHHVGRIHAFDIDDTDGAKLEKFRQRLRDRKLAYNIYSTHSHRADKVKVRVVVYADQDLPADTDEARELVAWIRKKIGEDLFDGEEDHSRHNAAGLIFLPSHNGSEEATAAAFSFFEPGRLLTLAPYIAQAKTAIAQARAGVVGARRESGTTECDGADRARKLFRLRENIRQGREIHASCVALAAMLWFDGRSEKEIIDDLESALYECEGAIDASRWRARFDNIPTVVKAQDKFAKRSPHFKGKEERRERAAEARVAAAEAEAAKEQKEQENRAQRAATRAELEAKIAELKRCDHLAASALVEMLAWLLLDAVTTGLLLDRIVEAVKPEAAGKGATEKVRKRFSQYLAEETKAAKAARDDDKRRADAEAKAREDETAERQERQERQQRAEAWSQTVARLTDRFKWILDAGGYWDVHARKVRPVKDVHNTIYSDLPLTENGTRVDARRVMLTNKASLYTALRYRPELPAEFTDEHGLRYLNAYRPTSLKPIEGDASPIVNHIRYVFGWNHKAPTEELARRNSREREYEHFLNVIAYKVQNPAAKIMQALCIGSEPRVGKGTIAKPLKVIFGEENYVEPVNDEIMKGKFEFVENKTCVVVHELRIPSDRRDIVAQLKQPISEYRLRIEPKYLNRYEVDCIPLFLTFTNYPDDLHIEAGDGRWWLFKSPVHPITDKEGPGYFASIEEHAAYFAELHAWLDGDGTGIFYDWLLKRDVSGFVPTAVAPWTPEKGANAENSRGEALSALEELYADRERPFAADIIHLETTLNYLRAKDGKGLSRLTKAALINFLRSKGGAQLGTGSVPFTYEMSGQEVKMKKRLWAIRDAEHWASLDPAAIGAELRRARGAGTLFDTERGYPAFLTAGEA